MHEAYPLALDGAPMFLALVLMNIFHPGTVLRGPGSEFTSRKERKQQKREKKEAKSEKKEARKAAKKAAKSPSHHIVAEVSEQTV